LDESIDVLRQIADRPNDILAEVAGITAGSWYVTRPLTSGMSTGAGMLILAGGRPRSADGL